MPARSVGGDVAAELGQGEALREEVVAHLRRGPDSISGVARALSEHRDQPIHRLTVAGYLQALADMGILKEVERPPAKLYRLQEPDAHRTLHQRLWRGAREGGFPRPRPLLLAALQTVLRRPVFQTELHHAGTTAEELPRVVMPDEARRAAKRGLARAPLRIQVPARDPTYALPEDELVALRPQVAALLQRVVLDASALAHMRHDREAGQQVALDTGGRR